MATRKRYADPSMYETKLERLTERLGVEGMNYNFDRHGAWVEFRYKGTLYRFDHTVENARAHGQELAYGSDAFAQIVLSVEDLARMVERGIYDLQTWVAGLRYLPAPAEILPCFKLLGFDSTPAEKSQVQARWRNLVKKYHPDAGGDPEQFAALQKAAEQAMRYFE